MRAIPLIALAALACSPASRTDTATTANENLALPAPLAAAIPAAVTADLGTAPTLGALRTFADWTIGCDNVHGCQANALVPDTGDRDHYLMLLIRRGGAADAAPRLIVPLGDKRAADPLLVIDGASFAKLAPDPGGRTASVTLDRARAAALADGRMVAMTTQRGPAIASASLAGLAAALLYMDDRQQRVGTTSALRKPGPRTTPPAPALPLIATPPSSTAKPRTLSASTATKLIGPDNAICDYAIGPVKPESYRLDATHSLVLVAHPCGNGAYNLFSSAFVLDDRGEATPAQFDAPPGIGEEDNGDIINADWNAGARRLTTVGKGRGIGDCGTQQAFAWDGIRFRLAEQRAMGECRGSIDYIPVWRAETATR